MAAAAGTHARHARFSRTHWPTETAWSVHGAAKEWRYLESSRFSRWVRSWVSISGTPARSSVSTGPARETSSAGWAWQAAPPDIASQQRKTAVPGERLMLGMLLISVGGSPAV